MGLKSTKPSCYDQNKIIIIKTIRCMLIYRNNKLQQVNNDYGYWADSTYHYYIKDYQGNVRAVIAQDGTLEEINNYYPYGSLMGGAAPGVQPFKYGAKELDRQNGINLLTSSLKKHIFYNLLINNILYLCVPLFWGTQKVF